MSEELTAKKPLQRILIIVSGLAFLGSTIFGLISLFTNGAEKPQVATSQETTSVEAQLKTQADGYSKVLAREPNNPVALQGLAEAKLKLNDLEGAIDPLEKLVKLYPQEANLQALLTAVKQQAEQQKQVKTENNQKDSKDSKQNGSGAK
jgi:cytochrome c-type biogenesis protein CcmH/NrfG